MGFTLQPAARRDLVDVAINVDLQQRARMIGWTSGRFWNHTVKAQRPEIQLIDKHVDHPHRVVLSNVVIQILGKQNALSTVFTLNEARHLTPPARIIQNYNSTGVFTQPPWEASGALGFPFSPFIRLLLVTGQRRAEVADMQGA